ncbi:glycosyltransferase family 9 protein [Aeromicrobium sp. Marseille-Q0843]|uniref:Glycosyltransferase family 9 protein n=2 Tax=Aeromicrobium phoceense TaxID=2754045 RepID=A0A838XS66_9ACTN|nr:glycosyltransferase family 9 protein [Aeromicrobium phoceense]MBA4609863.1 glycosyltransferase family 9 protein [Aeromicrobium phoceense]
MLVTGPAIRALASRGRGVVLLAGPQGAAAGAMLPGVDEVIQWRCPWIVADPPPVDTTSIDDLVAPLRARSISEAVVFTSFHQSALPTALVLQQAGIRTVTAISEDYPGSLLTTRVAPPGDVPEPERALATAEAAGFTLPPGDDGRLLIRADLLGGAVALGAAPFVVLHPGATAPSRTWPAHRWEEAVDVLVRRGVRTVVTGGPGETDLCARLARRGAIDLSGATSLVQLARVLRDATAVVVGNTGPAHLAAAVGTPVVSLFSPVVPAARWAPYGVPSVVLGDQDAPCRGSRARECPVPGHPCLTGVTAGDVVDALERLAPEALHEVAGPQTEGGIA